MIEFKKALIPDELAALCEFDQKAFHSHPADIFPVEEWPKYESYWMLVDGEVVGCAALQPYGDELWIASTAILPEFRGKGYGDELKKWQIEHARSRGFARMGTVMRQSNIAIISLNEKWGFRQRRLVHRRYSDPDEAGIEMELLIR